MCLLVMVWIEKRGNVIKETGNNWGYWSEIGKSVRSYLYGDVVIR
jgi:hypothetical protein